MIKPELLQMKTSKNCLPRSDEFFAEVVSKWAQDGLTDEKAQLLLNLIDSADGSVDDSEDAMLEELSMAELTGVDISEILKDKFPDYFE